MAGFDELEKRLGEMEQRQTAWNSAFHQAYARLRRERFGRWRRPDAAGDQELCDEARRAAGEDFARELFGFLDELCDAYLAEPLPHKRAKLRAEIGGNAEMLAALWAYAVQSAELVRGAEDALRLERALAAISIDDLRTDIEEVDRLLGRLWLQAARAGLDPRAAFGRVAAVSNPGMGGGGACLAPRLTAFETSLAFKRDVADELRRLPA